MTTDLNKLIMLTGCSKAGYFISRVPHIFMGTVAETSLSPKRCRAGIEAAPPIWCGFGLPMLPDKYDTINGDGPRTGLRRNACIILCLKPCTAYFR